jgi:hypothetical protein
MVQRPGMCRLATVSGLFSDVDEAPAAATRDASEVCLTATGRENVSRTIKLRGSHETGSVE